MQGNQIVNRIKARVTELGMTMAEFYKDCGISSGAVSQWRSGRTTPSMASLQNIAAYLGIPLSQLLEETKSPAPKEGEADIGDKITEFLLSLPKDRLRGILLSQGAPADLISELDHQE